MDVWIHARTAHFTFFLCAIVSTRLSRVSRAVTSRGHRWRPQGRPSESVVEAEPVYPLLALLQQLSQLASVFMPFLRVAGALQHNLVRRAHARSMRRNLRAADNDTEFVRSFVG